VVASGRAYQSGARGPVDKILARTWRSPERAVCATPIAFARARNIPAVGGYRRVRIMPTRMTRGLHGGAARALVLLTCLLTGCAGQQQVETVPARPGADATLKVVNGTASDVRVEADGRALGDVPAGHEQYFVGLAPGTFDLRGVSPDGALSFHRDLLTLEPGETFTWILREGEADAPPAGAAPSTRQTAEIVVENGTAWDVDVLLDGRVLGRAPAGRSSRFADVPTGAHRLEGRATETSFPLEFPVLEPGETFTWRLRAPGPIAGRGLIPIPGTGRLRVENPNAEPVTVLVNGVELGRVDARDVRIFDNLAAERLLLSGASVDGLTLYDGPELTVEPGGVALWRVGSGAPSDVTSLGPAAPAPASVSAPAPPAERPTPSPVDAVEPEEALARETGEVATPGAAQAAESAGPTFVVENHTGRDLEIFLDDESVGAVGAGMTGRFTDLPGPRFTPSATSANGARRFDHPEVDLTGKESFSWIIEP
jgi:hypothetical protein